MFEKLLALILHAKSGVVAAVLVAGTTTLVVTGTVTPENINLTLTPTATTSPTTSPSSTPNSSPLLVINLSPKASEKVKHAEKPQSCADAAHLRNDALKDVKAARDKARHDLDTLKALAKSKGLREEQYEKVLETAKESIDKARETADEAIQDLVSFKSEENEDENENEDNDEDDMKQAPGSATVSATPKPCPTVDAKTYKPIVELAKTQMQKAVDDATAKLATLTPSTKKVGDKKHDESQDGDD